MTADTKFFFDIIVAMDSNQGIGKSGRLPWHIPVDLKYFKEVTTKVNQSGKKNAVIMGRITWESIPEKYRPLKGRVNVVLSRNKDYPVPSEVILADSLDNALKMTQERFEIERVFVIGGTRLFEIAVNHPFCRKIMVTQIFSIFDCDTFFPSYLNEWRLVLESERFQHRSIHFSFREFLKKE